MLLQLKYEDAVAPIAQGSMAGSWDECSPRQFNKLVALIDTEPQTEAELLKVYARALPVVCSLTKAQLSKLPDETIADLFEGLEWMAQPIVLTQSKARWAGLFTGPKDFLDNITMDEFGFADAYFTAYMASGERADLHRFIGQLYRPPLVPYTKGWLNDVWTWCARWYRPRRKRAMVANYLGLRANLVKRYPRVFRGGKGGSSRHGWQGVIAGMAVNLKDFEATARGNINNAMVLIDQSIEQSDKQEAELNKMRGKR